MAPEGGIRGLLARGLRCAILPLPVSVSVPLLRLSGHLSILLSNCPCKNFQAGQHLSSVCYHHLQVSPLTLDHILSGHCSSNLLSNCQCQSLVDYHKEPHCTMVPLLTRRCLKSNKLRPILNGQFYHAIFKNIGLNLFGSKQPREILVFVILKL